MFSLGLTDLFALANPKATVAVNYGLAAVLWLVITGIVVGLVRRVG
jgi:Na+-translocating ferredoxin:NAD+ oxidoreductase RnfE subunit